MRSSPAFYEHNRDRLRIDPYLIFGKKMRKKERKKKRGKKEISKRRKIERETGALSWNSPAAQVSIQEGHRIDFVTLMDSHRFHKVFTRSRSKAYLNHIALNWQLIGCQRLHNSVACSPVPDNISQCFARSNRSHWYNRSRVFQDMRRSHKPISLNCCNLEKIDQKNWSVTSRRIPGHH